MKISELPGDEESGLTCRTYVFQNESHTLGNALKCIITRYKSLQNVSSNSKYFIMDLHKGMRHFTVYVTLQPLTISTHKYLTIRSPLLLNGEDVQFCGYTVPHPAEAKMHFRIQTNETPALEVLKRGLKDLQKVCDHTIDLFEKEVKEFNKT